MIHFVTRIAARFTDEHRAALDWLNEVTAEGVNFFGLEIELWKIASSPPAPRFNVISRPNDWSKQIASLTRGGVELSDAAHQNLDYWTGFMEYVTENSSLIRPRKPPSISYAEFAVGRSGFSVGASRYVEDDALGVWLWIHGKNATVHFHLLHEDREAIEQELGESLIWDHQNTRKTCAVILRWSGESGDDPAAWPGQFQRLLQGLESFHRTFSKRIKQLDASTYDHDLEADGNA